MITEVEVTLEKNQFQISKDVQNYKVVEASGWDLGAPLGYGSTPESAVMDFIDSWELKYNETITVKIV